MGAVVPIAFQAIQAFQAINTAVQIVDKGSALFSDKSGQTSDLALAQLQQKQIEEQRTLQANTTLQKQELALKAKEAEQARRLSLKKAVAKQRAAFGGSGISSGDGSSEAVLLGLFDQADEETKTSQQLDQLKSQALDQNVLTKTRQNVLERTQLAERERLKNKTSTLQEVSDLFSIF